MPLLIALLLVGLFSGCSPRSHLLEPTISYRPQEAHIASLPSPFPSLSKEERQKEWSKELILGSHFAKELDLYRAITCFKRALLLTPAHLIERRRQLEYELILCYYLGGKYSVVVELFEKGSIREVPASFPAFRNLLIVMYDTFEKVGEYDKACRILTLIEEYEPELARELQLGTAITLGELSTVVALSESSWLDSYLREKKSVRKAQALNALLPGAGYLYIGQKKTALTSFLLNAAFIAGTYQLFKEGHYALGAVVGSLEFGWYAGGINGAGLGAKQYNEHLYNSYGKEAMLEQRLFPVLLLDYAF